MRAIPGKKYSLRSGTAPRSSGCPPCAQWHVAQGNWLDGHARMRDQLRLSIGSSAALCFWGKQPFRAVYG